jgi:hypothetical protein
MSKNTSKEVKEVTLYNFATIRDPEYVNKEHLKENLNFICYNEEKPADVKVVKRDDFVRDFVRKDFLDFDKIKLKTKNLKKYIEPKINQKGELEYTAEQIDLQLQINKFYDRILYIAQSGTNDFYEINNLLLGLDTRNNVRINLSKTEELILQLKTWIAFIYNLKSGSDFKQKEIATNLLRFFHLKKYRNLIDDESTEDKIENFHKLINAQIIIPEELFPKSETFFYGEKQKLYSPKLELLKDKHTLKVLNLRKELSKNQESEKLDLLEAVIKDLKEEIEDQKKSLANDFIFDLNEFNNPYYVVTIEYINDKAYLLVTTDAKYEDFKDKVVEAILKIKEKEYIYNTEELISHQEFSPFDAHFHLYKYIDEDKDAKKTLKLVNEVVQPDRNSDKEIGFSLTLNFHSENESIISKELKWKGKVEFKHFIASGYLNQSDAYGKAFKPSGYGIQMLGVADYRKVVSTISRYVPAEVAHIENLMAGEFRDKVTTKEISTEITEFESTENETEKLNETTTNDRFQMQNEVARILNDQRTNNTTANVGYSNSGFYANLTTGNSSTTSREDSNKQAVTNAKEITNKAVEKIVSKTKKERTVKITEKFIDVNKYGFDNRGNDKHISGVYRHINAVYRNRVHNYGKRMTFEFSIPEPARVFKLGKKNIDDYNLEKIISSIPKPSNPLDFFEDSTKINQENIKPFFKEFGLKIPNQFRLEFKFRKEGRIGGTTTFFNIGEITEDYYTTNDGMTFSLNDYIPINWSINGWVEYQGHGSRQVGLVIDNQRFILSSGNEKVDIVKSGSFLTSNTMTTIELYGGIEFCTIYEFNINFKLKDDLFIKWQNEQYHKMLEQYVINKSIYDKAVEEEISKYKKYRQDILAEENDSNNKNKLKLRDLELNTLKRNCQSYLLDQESLENKTRKFGASLIKFRNDFKNIKVKLNQELDEYTAFVRFLEQAFEWDNMSYTFYPYYWGDELSWKENYNEDSDDLLHKAFLQAGMARVIVTVRPKFEDAVNMYLTTGKIWMGGNLPVYGSSLFVSIANELKNDAEYTVEDEWESVLPTNLIALQSSGVAIQQEGLPNLEDYLDLGKIKDNPEKLPLSNKRKKFLGLF